MIVERGLRSKDSARAAAACDDVRLTLGAGSDHLIDTPGDASVVVAAIAIQQLRVVQSGAH